VATACRALLSSKGQDLIEYALLATFVSLLVIVGIGFVTSAINNAFSSVASQAQNTGS
jgi:Flp pilus assembly pilin Flp